MAGSALWLWSSPDASRALRTRELGQILRTYRRLNGISQERLAVLLGYDKTYISMIETRRRVINDVGTLRQIAHTLGIPVHALGVTEADDATFAAMMQFAGSVLSLAEIARKSGHASDAVDELWPLVARLESRAAEGLIERESLAVLGQARLSLGVALGTLLPDEKLTSAAKWAGRALLIATHLGEPVFMTEALTMHGNELRKAGRIPVAMMRLRHAIVRSADAGTGATANAMLARAAGEAGQAELFDDTMRATGCISTAHPSPGCWPTSSPTVRSTCAVSPAPDAVRGPSRSCGARGRPSRPPRRSGRPSNGSPLVTCSSRQTSARRPRRR